MAIKANALINASSTVNNADVILYHVHPQVIFVAEYGAAKVLCRFLSLP